MVAMVAAMSDGLGMNESQAARVLGVHRDTLRAWRKAGAVSYCLTPTGRIFYTQENLHQLRAAMRVEASVGRKTV